MAARSGDPSSGTPRAGRGRARVARERSCAGRGEGLRGPGVARAGGERGARERSCAGRGEGLRGPGVARAWGERGARERSCAGRGEGLRGPGVARAGGGAGCAGEELCGARGGVTGAGGCAGGGGSGVRGRGGTRVAGLAPLPASARASARLPGPPGGAADAPTSRPDAPRPSRQPHFDDMFGVSFRDPSLLLAVTIIGVTVVLLALRNMNSRRRHTTLQDSETKYPLPLIEKEQITHNTRRFRFGLPSPDHVLGLPVGNYVHLLAKIDGVLVVRAYTPVSSDDDRGFVDLIIKIYFKNVHPNYPEGGKMTQYLENMKIGDTILFRGPTGRLFYHKPGNFSIKAYKTSEPEKKLVSHLGMIAGGTGITPMLQLIRHITKNPSDRTRMSLIFANQTEEDILVRKELEEVARTHPEQFDLWYTLDRPPVGWKYSSGYITANMIKEHLPPPGQSTLILVCGPLPLIQTTAHPNLEKLGYTKDMIFTY
ncbi:NADH-cytochrome b5 reductase 2 isoform X2 [Halichoerus grypus]